MDNRPQEHNVLSLAYLGDSVFEVFVREYLIISNKTKPNLLHKEAIKIVNAKTQARIYASIINDLTEEEQSIANRAKNSKIHRAISMNLADYKLATAFEAVLGYLYIQGKQDRIDTICKKALGIINL